MLRVAGPGEVLGLSASMSGRPYEVTAEMLDASQVAFVRRKDLLHFLRENRVACLQVVHLLSQDLHQAYDRVRSIGLSRARRPAPGACGFARLGAQQLTTITEVQLTPASAGVFSAPGAAPGDCRPRAVTCPVFHVTRSL